MKNFTYSKVSLILICFILTLTTKVYSQNLMAGWDGNGINGTGSEPSNFGWTADGADFRPTGITGEQQQLSTCYRDYNNVRYFLTGEKKTFYYKVTLKAGKKYNFFTNVFYFDVNCTDAVPFSILDESLDPVTEILVEGIPKVGNAPAKEVKMDFSITKDGIYYVSFSNVKEEGWRRLALSDFSLTEDLESALNDLSFGKSTISTNKVAYPGEFVKLESIDKTKDSAVTVSIFSTVGKQIYSAKLKNGKDGFYAPQNKGVYIVTINSKNAHPISTKLIVK